MPVMRVHPGSEPLPAGGDVVIERLHTVLATHFGDAPSDGWWIAIDTCRRDARGGFSVAVWQQSAAGQWLGEPFLHPCGHHMPVEERFAEWLAEREVPVPSCP